MRSEIAARVFRRNGAIGLRGHPLVNRAELLDQLGAAREEHHPERLVMRQVADAVGRVPQDEDPSPGPMESVRSRSRAVPWPETT